MDIPEPKKRILDTAISLIAKKGFSAVGIREIATAADVNISMISYYFNGKTGVLKAIFELFFETFAEVFKDLNDENKTPEECFKYLIERTVEYIKNNTELFITCFAEMTLDNPELVEMKAKKVWELIDTVSGLLKRLGINPKDRLFMSIITPAYIGIILTHFRLSPMISKIYGVKLDDNFYQTFNDMVSDILLSGIKSTTSKMNKKGESK